MINVTDGPDVHVRLAALEFLLRHVPLTSHLGDPARAGDHRAGRSPSTALQLKIWSGGRDLNPQPSPWKSETLPLSYPRPVLLPTFSLPPRPTKFLEPGTGIEPVTSSLPRTRSTN